MPPKRKYDTTMALPITIETFKTFFGDECKQMLDREDNFIQSERVISFVYDKNCNHLQGEVQRSMRKGSHKVRIELSVGKILSAFCPCARGQARCAHMAAILLSARRRISPTDLSCVWSKRKTPDDNSIVTVDSIYQSNTKSKKFEPTYDAVSPDREEEFRQLLSMVPSDSATGVRFLLKPKPIPRSASPAELSEYQPPNAFAIISDEELSRSDDIERFVIERLVLSRAEIIDVARLTVGQAASPLWATVRSGRLTGSRFGQILAAMKKRGGPAPSRSLLQSLTYHRNLDGVKSITWGKTHESIAIKAFSESEGVDVQPTGIWLHDSGILGASTDGLVGEEGILEVKCPFSLRTVHPESALAEPKKFKKWCVFRENGVWKVDIAHVYYHQVQGCLYLTRRKYAFFVIWTPKGIKYTKIEKDSSWKSNLELLKIFYFAFFIPFVRSVQLQ